MPKFQVMRNMVNYVIVAHKTDEKGRFVWNTKVNQYYYIDREVQNIWNIPLQIKMIIFFLYLCEEMGD